MAIKSFQKIGCYLCLLACQLALPAQEEPAGDLSPGRMLVVNLSTKLMQVQAQAEESVAWAMESVKTTTFGQTVSVKLTGEDFVIFVRLTPFLQNRDSILLIAQGEIFYSVNGAGDQYHSTVRSLSVTPGEKVIFFPLGRAVDPESNLYYIEMEIQVVPGEESSGL